jgi:hypothetical protein
MGQAAVLLQYLPACRNLWGRAAPLPAVRSAPGGRCARGPSLPIKKRRTRHRCGVCVAWCPRQVWLRDRGRTRSHRRRAARPHTPRTRMGNMPGIDRTVGMARHRPTPGTADARSRRQCTGRAPRLGSARWRHTPRRSPPDNSDNARRSSWATSPRGPCRATRNGRAALSTSPQAVSCAKGWPAGKSRQRAVHGSQPQRNSLDSPMVILLGIFVTRIGISLICPSCMSSHLHS